MQEMETARRAAKVGVEVLAKYFRGDAIATTTKDGTTYDLVSEADLESEKAIVAAIHESFPDHAILGEESHRDDVSAEHLWIIDPLDGTTNFLHGIPHFAVSIAYYRDQQPVCGIVANPARDDWYEATRGGGATHNGKPIRVTTASKLDEVLVGVGFYYDRGAMMEATLDSIGDLFHAQIRGIRRFGTAALDLAHVASGYYGAFFEYEQSPWDFAAGRLLVEEAGGRISTCPGESLPLQKSSLLASNGPLHDAMLRIVGHRCP